MKKWIPFLGLLVLVACNNVTSNTNKEISDSFNAVDARLRDTTQTYIDSSNSGVGADTSLTTNNQDTLQPALAKSVEKWRNNKPIKKTAVKSKAKIDSVAIREANKLPLDQ